MTLRVGFIGTGDDRKRGPLGFGMAHRHAEGYKDLADRVKLVACCDIIAERADRFADLHGVPNTYYDHHQMLSQENLDIVSIATWPDSHLQLTLDTIAAGVKAIHCEKPMAVTWAEAKQMTEAATQAGVFLTFNHQRRFGLPFRQAKELLDQGNIGDLRMIQCGVGDIYDYGSHNWDMASYFNNLCAPKWILAQVDYRKPNLIFGVHNENQAVAIWEYENGVLGQLCTGLGAGIVGCHQKLIGSHGEIMIGPSAGGPVLQIRRSGSGWEAVDCQGEICHGPTHFERAIADIVRAVETGVESELKAENALKATEIMFACWESVRRRGRVEFPLTVQDNALESMVQSGVFPLQDE